MLNPSKKSIKSFIKPFAYNFPLLLSLIFKIAINIRDINLCLNFLSVIRISK
jgi:hypothetical protein